MRICIADPQPKVRFALRVLLERQSGLEVMGEAGDAESLKAQVEIACPDAILLSWELSGMPMENLVRDLREICPEMTVIVLSGRLEAHRASIALGADAFVSKSNPPEQLLATIASCGCRTQTQTCSTGDSENRTIPSPEA